MKFLSDHHFECPDCGWHVNGPHRFEGPYCVECGAEMMDFGVWWRLAWRSLTSFFATGVLFGSDADDRGQMQFSDVAVGFFMLVALVATFPLWNEFINMIAAEADPLTALLLKLIYPLFIIGLIVSMGVSARRGGTV